MSATKVLEIIGDYFTMAGVGLSTNRRTNYRMRDDDALTHPIIGAGKRLECRRIFPPDNVDLWRDRIRRYVWVPSDTRFVNSFRRRPSFDSSPGLERLR